MNTSLEKPAIYDLLHKVFGVDWEAGIAIAYGDIVHSKYPLAPDIAAHEAVHIKQQKEIGTVEWWEKYINDPKFRLSQEVEAYQEQIAWLSENVKDRNELYRKKRKIMNDISSSMYGDMCTYYEAQELLTG